jgi:hypothetical protein
MARMCLPDGAVRGIDFEGARTGARTGSYTPGKDGTITVDNPRHIKALREMGAFAANLGGRTSGGFRCECGFGSYFKTCSRCGGTCEKES